MRKGKVSVKSAKSKEGGGSRPKAPIIEMPKDVGVLVYPSMKETFALENKYAIERLRETRHEAASNPLMRMMLAGPADIGRDVVAGSSSRNRESLKEPQSQQQLGGGGAPAAESVDRQRSGMPDFLEETRRRGRAQLALQRELETQDYDYCRQRMEKLKMELHEIDSKIDSAKSEIQKEILRGEANRFRPIMTTRVVSQALPSFTWSSEHSTLYGDSFGWKTQDPSMRLGHTKQYGPMTKYGDDPSVWGSRVPKGHRGVPKRRFLEAAKSTLG